MSNDVLTSIAKELFERYPNGASHSVLRSVEMYSLRNLVPKSQSILLDLGCGEGIFFMIFKKKFSITCKNIIGVDVNENELREAVKLGVYNNLICCDARLLPFKDNSIEICMSVSVLEHIPQYLKVLTEVERVLMYCSTFYTTVVNAEVFSSNFVIPKLMAQIPGMKDMQKKYIQKHKLEYYHHLVNNSAKDWLVNFQRSKLRLERVIGIWTPEFIYASSKLGIINYILRFFPKGFRSKFINRFFDQNLKNYLSDPDVAGTLYLETTKSSNKIN